MGKLDTLHTEPKIRHVESLQVEVGIKQLIIAKRLEDNSTYFHCENKGCEIEEVMEEFHKSRLVRLHCKTHGVNCQRSGWQIGYSYGTSSKELSNIGRPKL
jgi:hypothetical protein